MKRSPHLLFVALLLMMAPPPAGAMINPDLFKRGPEQLVVKVVGRSVQNFGELVSVQILAEVVSVKKSATGLKPGHTILISYTRNPAEVARKEKALTERSKRGWTGSQVLHPPVAPRVGLVMKVYLRQTAPNAGRVYGPTGHQYSFEPVK